MFAIVMSILCFGIAIAAVIRLLCIVYAPVLEDISAAFRAAVREFRNRRWYRRVRANIHTEF